MNIHRAQDRGLTKFKWLTSYHSFSFGKYHNPTRREFGKLVVFNDDYITTQSGFGVHGHENMEIVTIMLEGELTHGDTMSNKRQLIAGEVQHMSAGRGVRHFEYNHSDKPLHLLQIWIEPESLGLEPSYQQESVELEFNSFVVIAAKSGGALPMAQEGSIERGLFEKGRMIVVSTQEGFGIFLFMIEGKVKVDHTTLSRGDSVQSGVDIDVEVLESADLVVVKVPY